MSLCEHCIKGVTHEGTPKGKLSDSGLVDHCGLTPFSTGKFEKIGGVDTYVATPTVDYPKDKAILFLPDIFGAQFINSQLLADDFAANGFKTYIPDYLNGDPVPPDALDPGSTYDLMKWLSAHSQEVTRPPLDKVITALKAEGITAFGATGYCLGAAVVSHPSHLKTPDDLEKYVATSKAPLLINSCTTDLQFPLESSAKADELFTDFAPGYKRVHFEGMTHGFAVRGNMADPREKEAKEGAFRSAIEWFIAKL